MGGLFSHLFFPSLNIILRPLSGILIFNLFGRGDGGRGRNGGDSSLDTTLKPLSGILIFKLWGREGEEKWGLGEWEGGGGGRGLGRGRNGGGGGGQLT